MTDIPNNQSNVRLIWKIPAYDECPVIDVRTPQKEAAVLMLWAAYGLAESEDAKRLIVAAIGKEAAG